MENGGKNCPNKKLPTLKKGSSLKGTVSKNNVLERMTNDAFNIVSSLSSSETVIGAWVINKEAAIQLQNICDEWAKFTGLSSNSDYYKIAAQFMDIYQLEAIQTKFSWQLTFELFRSGRIFSPSYQGVLRQRGFDREVFSEKLSELRIKPLKCLKLNEVDKNLRYLNYSYDGISGIEKISSADFSKFSDLEYLRCTSHGFEKINFGNMTTIVFLDCSYNRLLNLNLENSILSILCITNLIVLKILPSVQLSGRNIFRSTK